MKKATPRSKKKKKRTTSSRRVNRDDTLPEYDFRGGRPNPYAERYAASKNVVKLDPDVAAVFPNARAVNDALRALAAIIREHRSRESEVTESEA
jgi:hypothetical protein